jgi:hypothetical protein
MIGYKRKPGVDDNNIPDQREHKEIIPLWKEQIEDARNCNDPSKNRMPHPVNKSKLMK